MLIRILTVAAAVLAAGAGLVHGRWTNRWSNSAALAEAARRIQALPGRVGEWTSTDRPLGEAERKAAGAVGSSSRRYRNEATGETISTLLICGLPGAVGAHTPDVCYAGGGYAVEEPAALEVPRGDGLAPAQFLAAAAVRGGADPSTLRIFWSWNDGRGWRAPGDPRWTFAAAPVLTKLYVIRETAGSPPADGADPCLAFLDAMLPVLDRDLFATSPEASDR